MTRLFICTDESSRRVGIVGDAPVTSHRYRPFVIEVLFDAAGAPSPTRAQIILAFNTLCDQLGAVLEPLFGRRAIDALFVRARHLAARDFPRLSAVLGKDDERCRLDALDEPAASAADLAEMLGAVLAYKIDLLIAFVGDDLVMPLVRRAWPASAARSTSNDETL